MAFVHPPLTDGVRLPLGTRIIPTKHARNGGNPYPTESRQMAISLWENAGGDNGGFAAFRTPQIMQLRLDGDFPHETSTVRRWIKTHQNYGHVLPKRATGNLFLVREVDGIDLVNLTLFRLIRPKANIDEVRAYIHNRNPDVEPYSPSQICRAEQRLGITRKVGSTTSIDAYTPINLFKRDNYWQQEYPFGVSGEETAIMIDIDECQFKLESQNHKHGKTIKGARCDSKGVYKNGAKAVSLLMGISGSEDEPFYFHQTFSEGGTDLYRFYCFMEDFISFLALNRQGQSFCFMMDNLNIHKNPLIISMIEDAGRRVVYRAPYWSCDGAIEYVFNTLHTLLQMDTFNGATDVNELMLRIGDKIHLMGLSSFTPYFIHVGFPE